MTGPTRDLDRPVPGVDDVKEDGPSREITTLTAFTVRERDPPEEGEMVSPGGKRRNLALERKILDLLGDDLHRAVLGMELALGKMRKRGSFYCTGYANGEPVQVLIDEGAEVTLVNQDILDQMPSDVRPYVYKSPLLVSGMGCALNVTGMVELIITIAGVTAHHSALVVEEMRARNIDLLMGGDFTEDHDFFMHASKREAHFQDVWLPIYRVKMSYARGRLIARKTVRVKARTKATIEVKVEGHPRDFDMCAELIPAWAHGDSSMPIAVVNLRERSEVKLTITHAGAEDLTIEKGEILAVLMPITSVTGFEEEKNVEVRFLQSCLADIVPQCNHLRGEIPGEITAETQKEGAQGSDPGDQLTHEDVAALLPEYLRCMVADLHESLTPIEAYQLVQILLKHEKVFQHPDRPLGRSDIVQHSIDVQGHRPLKQPPRRLPYHKLEIVKAELDKMIKSGVIRDSTSPWASPIVLVTKKDGTTRFCIDYRRLNDVTRKDAFPLPRIDESLDTLSGAKYFCTLDLASGYWQVGMLEEDKAKTAFCTRFGLFEFNVMPFGLSNAPATFERLTEHILRGMQWKEALVYIDDIIVFGTTFSQCLGRLSEIFRRFEQHGLTFKPKKCDLFKKEVEFLGHRVSAEGVSCDPKKIEKVRLWTPPTTVTEVRSFLGMTGYYRRFIKDYADKAHPLTNLTKLTVAFEWDSDCEAAFEFLKHALITAPILSYPDMKKEFILDTDASGFAAGAVLSQVYDDGEEKPVAYASFTFNTAEKNYCTTHRELLAVVRGVKQFRHYLLGRQFLVRTDHASLVWLKNFKDAPGKVARWIFKLEEFDYRLEYRKGVDHGNADAMSRMPIPKIPREKGDRLCQFLPCGDCLPKRTAKEITILSGLIDYEGCKDEGVQVSMVRVNQVVTRAQAQMKRKDKGYERRMRMLARRRKEEKEVEVSPDPTSQGLEKRGRLPSMQLTEETPSVMDGMRGELVAKRKRGRPRGPRVIPVVTRRSTRLEEKKPTTIEPEPEPQNAVEQHCTPDGVLKEVEKGNEVRMEMEDEVVEVIDEAGGAEVMPGMDDLGNQSVLDDSFEEEPEDIPAESSPLERICMPESNWMEVHTVDQLREMQEGDPELLIVLGWKKQGFRPRVSNLQTLAPRVRSLYIQWNTLQLIDGVLYRVIEDSKFHRTMRQLVVPTSYRGEIFKVLHKGLMSGHMGKTRTIEAVKQRFYWPNYRSDLKLWIRRCRRCCEGKSAPQHHPRVPLRQKKVSAPLDVIAFDVLTLTRTGKGNKYILMIVDHFTKWVEAYPIANHNAATVARTLAEEWICRYGTPRVLHSDQGTEFTGHLMSRLYSLLQIHKTKTPTYRPQGNGQCERMNRTACKMLSMFVDKFKDTEWDDILPYLMSAYRRSVHESTGVTPNKMMYGRECNLPLDLIIGSPLDKKLCPVEYVEEIQYQLQMAHAFARERLNITAARQKRVYDHHAGPGRSFNEGDNVMYFYPPKNRKLSRAWEHHIVLRQLGASGESAMYEISKGEHCKPRHSHIDNLKPYEGDEPMLPWWVKTTRRWIESEIQTKVLMGDIILRKDCASLGLKEPIEECIQEGTVVEALAKPSLVVAEGPLPSTPILAIPVYMGVATAGQSGVVMAIDIGEGTSAKMLSEVKVEDKPVLWNTEWDTPEEELCEAEEPSLRDRLMKVVMQTPRCNRGPWMKLPSAERYSRDMRPKILDQSCREEVDAPMKNLFQKEEGSEKGGCVEMEREESREVRRKGRVSRRAAEKGCRHKRKIKNVDFQKNVENVEVKKEPRQDKRPTQPVVKPRRLVKAAGWKAADWEKPPAPCEDVKEESGRETRGRFLHSQRAKKSKFELDVQEEKWRKDWRSQLEEGEWPRGRARSELDLDRGRRSKRGSKEPNSKLSSRELILHGTVVLEPMQACTPCSGERKMVERKSNEKVTANIEVPVQKERELRDVTKVTRVDSEMTEYRVTLEELWNSYRKVEEKGDRYPYGDPPYEKVENWEEERKRFDMELRRWTWSPKCYEKKCWRGMPFMQPRLEPIPGGEEVKTWVKWRHCLSATTRSERAKFQREQERGNLLEIDEFDGETIEVVALEGEQSALAAVGGTLPKPTKAILMAGAMHFRGWHRLKGKCYIAVKYGFWTQSDPKVLDAMGDNMLPPCYVYQGSPMERKPWRGRYYTYGLPSTPSDCE